jgi:hypothetical protein
VTVTSGKRWSANTPFSGEPHARTAMNTTTIDNHCRLLPSLLLRRHDVAIDYRLHPTKGWDPICSQLGS